MALQQGKCSWLFTVTCAKYLFMFAVCLSPWFNLFSLPTHLLICTLSIGTLDGTGRWKMTELKETNVLRDCRIDCMNKWGGEKWRNTYHLIENSLCVEDWVIVECVVYFWEGSIFWRLNFLIGSLFSSVLRYLYIERKAINLNGLAWTCGFAYPILVAWSLISRVW